MLTHGQKQFLLEILGEDYLLSGDILFCRIIPEHLINYLRVGPHTGISLPLRYDLTNVEDQIRILYCHVIPVIPSTIGVFGLLEFEKEKGLHALPVLLNLLSLENSTASNIDMVKIE